MVKDIVVRTMFFSLTLFALCQPFVTRVDNKCDGFVKSYAHYMAQKAAVDGNVPTALKQEVVDKLTSIGFSASDIQITSTSYVVGRGQRIDVEVKVRKRKVFAYIGSSSSPPQYYYGKGSAMSEYLF